MTLSSTGLDFLKRAEGFRATLYPDADGWAIGYGCQVNPADWHGKTISESEAEALMRERVCEAEAAVNRAVALPLAQHQFDSLVSLAYNIGVTAFRGSTLVRCLNRGDTTGAADEFLRWRYSKKSESPQLLARRKLERAMFLGESKTGGAA